MSAKELTIKKVLKFKIPLRFNMWDKLLHSFNRKFTKEMMGMKSRKKIAQSLWTPYSQKGKLTNFLIFKLSFLLVKRNDR